jgi:hypothetical protein
VLGVLEQMASGPKFARMCSTSSSIASALIHRNIVQSNSEGLFVEWYYIAQALVIAIFLLFKAAPVGIK